MSRLLFLSHSGIDTEAARALKARMVASPAARAQGLHVWFDKEDLRAGEPWQSQIEEAIRQSHAFAVYVGSKGVVNWVEAEVRLALNRAITEPNSYEDSPCQEINYPYERFFFFFSAFRVPAWSALSLVL